MLSAGSLLDYDFSLPDVVGGEANDLAIVNGALTLDGSLNLADAGGLSRGVYRIINYGGGAHRQRPRAGQPAEPVPHQRDADLDRHRRARST